MTSFWSKALFYYSEVNQAYQEKGNMAKVLPEYLSDWTTEKGKCTMALSEYLSDWTREG